METATEEAQPGWRVVGPSWSSAKAAFLSMKPLFISAAIATLLLTIFAVYAPGLFDAQTPAEKVGTGLLISIPVLLLRLLILAPVAVAVHRFILLGERTPGIISLRPAYTRRFALWLCALSLIGFMIIALSSVLALMDFFGAVGKLSFVIIVLVSLFFYIVFVLIFPAIAIDEPSMGLRDRLSASWRRMDGHFWLFVGLSIITILPVAITVFVVGGIAGAMDVLVFGPHSGPTSLDFGVQVIADLAQILTAMLGAAVASHFYARFRDQTLPGTANAG